MTHAWLLVAADRSPELGRLDVAALILDIAAAASPQSRDQAVARIASARRSGTTAKLYARVNAFATTSVDLDLDAVMPARPDGIVLPDAVGGPDLSRLGTMLAVREAEAGLDDGSTRIIATVSSARGLFALGSLAGVSRRLAGVLFDAQSLRRELGAQTVLDATGALADPYRVARGLTLLAAAAAGVQAIDAPSYEELADLQALRDESRSARRDGFAAKLARHPREVTVINAAFRPDIAPGSGPGDGHR